MKRKNRDGFYYLYVAIFVALIILGTLFSMGTGSRYEYDVYEDNVSGQR